MKLKNSSQNSKQNRINERQRDNSEISMFFWTTSISINLQLQRTIFKIVSTSNHLTFHVKINYLIKKTV